jgi:hypothetical protein
MKEWFIVKNNWTGIMQNYIGLGGDCYPDTDVEYNLYKKIQDRRIYVDYKGVAIYVLTNFILAKEYFIRLKQNQLKTIIISISHIEKENVDGYDFGNPEGGYSIIESEILSKNRNDLIKEYLNENYLFKDIESMKKFLDNVRNFDNDVEEMNSYREVSIKQIFSS